MAPVPKASDSSEREAHIATRETVLFAKPGKQNTQATLAAARRRALKLGAKGLVVATSTGETALCNADRERDSVLQTVQG
jgi:hypothetical protein